MASPILKSILGITLFSFSSLVNATETQDHILSIEKLEQRPLLIRFTTSNDAPFVLVRADIEDLEGFTTKDQRKTQQEREKFQNQFDIKASKKILENYKNAQKWKVEAFKTYQFGLFSIYRLQETAVIFCGELYLDDQSLSQGGFIEVSTDIDPTRRNQGIGTAVKKAVLEQILTPNLGRSDLTAINYLGTSSKSLMRKKGFPKSKTPLRYLKSKVEFSNLPSHKINNALGMVPWNFSVDYSVVYVYPQFKSAITQEAMPLVEALTSSNDEERQEAIQILTHSINSMK